MRFEMRRYRVGTAQNNQQAGRVPNAIDLLSEIIIVGHGFSNSLDIEKVVEPALFGNLAQDAFLNILLWPNAARDKYQQLAIVMLIYSKELGSRIKDHGATAITPLLIFARRAELWNRFVCTHEESVSQRHLKQEHLRIGECRNLHRVETGNTNRVAPVETLTHDLDLPLDNQ